MCHLQEVVVSDCRGSCLSVHLINGRLTGSRTLFIGTIFRTTDQVTGYSANAGTDQGILAAMLPAADHRTGDRAHDAAQEGPGNCVVVVVIGSGLIDVRLSFGGRD